MREKSLLPFFLFCYKIPKYECQTKIAIKIRVGNTSGSGGGAYFISEGGIKSSAAL
jgi:hypothetical protein